MKKYNQYLDDITSGRTIACRKLQSAIKRHIHDLERSKSDDYKYYFDEAEADKAIAFVESLIMYEGTGAGKNLILEPWQAFIVASLFGWLKKSTKTRRYRKSFVFVARGNGKSPLMSAIALMFLIKDAGGQVYSIATTANQSSIIFNWAKNYIASNPKLSEAIDVFSRSLEYRKKASVMRPLSKAFQSFDGFNPSAIVADEVAAMKDNSLLDIMTTALFKRPESILLMITTANFVASSPGYLEYGYASKVLNGLVDDDEYFACIYELDEEDDWKDERVYRKSNPASFVDIEQLIHERDVAISAPYKERSFRTKNLNQWLLGGADSWITDKAWSVSIDNAEKYKDYITEEKLKTYPCAIGLDFAKRDDFSASVIAFYIAQLDKYYLKHRYYIPSPQIEEKLKTDTPMIWKWIQDGLITATEYPTIDNERIAADVIHDFETYHPMQVLYDPALSQEMLSMLNVSIPTMAISQKAIVMSEPTKDFDTYIVNGKIIDDNPVMRWNVNNTKVERWNNLLKLVKSNKDSPLRIDGVAAAIMALMPLTQSRINKPAEEPKYSFDIQFV